jgi:hypothetical protein
MKHVVEVTYDHQRGYYVASHPDLSGPVAALSLAGLRRALDQLFPGDEVRLVLDRLAQAERDKRRLGGHGGPEQWSRRR